MKISKLDTSTLPTLYKAIRDNPWSLFFEMFIIFFVVVDHLDVGPTSPPPCPPTHLVDGLISPSE